MAASPLERRFTSLHIAVPKLDVIRLRVIARAEELAHDRDDIAGTREQTTDASSGNELRIASADGLIAGRIDRIILTADGPILQDYKSGAILSFQPDGTQELKPAYTLQLRLLRSALSQRYENLALSTTACSSSG
jgi:ATP-dependent exoDNAse (exonuclease V) beta subunit